MNRKHIAALAIATLASAPAFSQVYVGAAGGVSHANVDCTGTDSCDNSGTAAKVLVGYEFAKAFSAEATYYWLGTVKTSTEGIGVDFKGSYVGLGGAYRPAFGSSGWGGVVRVGAAFTTGKIESTGISFSHDTTQPYFGLGLTYAVTKDLKAELDWDNTKVEYAVQDVSTTGTVNSFVIGATYSF